MCTAFSSWTPFDSEPEAQLGFLLEVKRPAVCDIEPLGKALMLLKTEIVENFIRGRAQIT